jgi:hypothetical protein
VFGIMFAAVLAMAGMPSAWCVAFPLSMAMAALLLVQQRGGAVASIKLPGSRLLMVLQGCLLATWGCGLRCAAHGSAIGSVAGSGDLLRGGALSDAQASPTECRRIPTHHSHSRWICSGMFRRRRGMAGPDNNQVQVFRT